MGQLFISTYGHPSMGVRCGGVVILGATCQSATPLQLIIATCRVFRHLGTTEEADNPQRELAFAQFCRGNSKEWLPPKNSKKGDESAAQFRRDAEKSVAGKLTWDAPRIRTPSCGPDQLFRENFGDSSPFGFVIDCLVVVAFGAPRRFEVKVCGYRHCEEGVRVLDIEGFSAAGQVRIQHPSSSKAHGNVVDHVGEDLDANRRAIVTGVLLRKDNVHLILELLHKLFSRAWRGRLPGSKCDHGKDHCSWAAKVL